MPPSVMNHNFSQVPEAEIQRSSFDRSHGHKTTFDAGWLIPVFLDEALPGDTFNCRMNAFARLATPIKPVMDNMFLESFFFAVPYRLVWDNWQKMNGEQRDPGDSTDFVVPHMVAPNHAAGGIAVGSLSDYFGLPTGPLAVGNTGVVFDSLFHRAYNLIWNEWFRDQNLQNHAVVDHGDGPDTYTDYVLRRRGKRHDYFTSCLPWPQKGPDVLLPLGSSAPIVGNGNTTPVQVWQDQSPNGGANTLSSLSVTQAADAATSLVLGTLGANPEPLSWKFDNNAVAAGLHADLTTATASTINAIREAFQLQRMYERDARGGTRYTEILRSHFGVISPDARLQRPEYLGGGSTPVSVSPIAQTGPTAAGVTPQANLAGMGVVAVHGHGFTKSFTEHCLLIGLVSVRADLTYQQGMNRMWSRQTRFDFFWPALAHLGEQAVLNKEIYTQGPGVAGNPDDGVFGYQERYAEYRYKPSLITGEFRSTYATPLDVWHLSQKFTSLPTLGDTFIQDDPPIDRVIAVPSEPHFIFDSYFELQCARPMPVYGVPGMIDHF